MPGGWIFLAEEYLSAALQPLTAPRYGISAEWDGTGLAPRWSIPAEWRGPTSIPAPPQYTIPAEWRGAPTAPRYEVPADWTQSATVFPLTAPLYAIPADWGGVNPFSLVLLWNVRQPLRAPLVLNWRVITGGIINPSMQLSWNVRQPLQSLRLSWRVLPNIVPLFSSTVQRPTV